jgi:hypothetical protein
LREDLDFVEHGKTESTQDGLTIRRLLHLGSMKGCPLCKDVQRKNLSQIREYRFSIKSGELFKVLATCFAYEEDEQPLWDLIGNRSRLFDQVYPLEVRDEVAKSFMELVHAEFGGSPDTIRRGSDAELDRFERDYLRRQKGEKPSE